MGMMYKMLKGEVAMDFTKYFTLKSSNTHSKYDGHLFVPSSKNDLVLNNFFIRSIKDWNQLDREIFSAKSADEFMLKMRMAVEREELPPTRASNATSTSSK